MRRNPDPRQQRPGETTLQVLERRLDEGYARIEEAIARGEDVTAWTDFWVQLLRQYEERVDIERELMSGVQP